MPEHIDKLADKLAEMMSTRKSRLTVSLPNKDIGPELVKALKLRGYGATAQDAVIGTRDSKGSIESLESKPCVIVRPKRAKKR